LFSDPVAEKIEEKDGETRLSAAKRLSDKTIERIGIQGRIKP
jgi:hypothetical protein